MADLSFKQSESRNFVVPVLIALVIAGAVAGYVYLTPHRIADIAITHTAVYPTHTVFKTNSKLVGAKDEIQDALYVLATIRIDNHSKVPLRIDDISGTLTPQDNASDPSTVTAIQKANYESIFITFPALKPMAGPPLSPETTIQPGDHAEGMVMLNFPNTEADWNQRKSASVTIGFYNQEPFTVTIPKP